MRKPLVVVLLGITTAVLLCLCIVQYRQIHTLSTAQAPQKPALAPVAVDAVEKVPAAPEEPKRDVRAAPDMPKEIPPARPMARPTPPAAAVAPPAKESFMSGIAKMMKDPAMQEMIRTQQKGQMNIMYGSLFKYLQLSESDLEAFKEALMDKQMKLVEASMEMMNNATTPEGRAAATDKIKAMTEEYDARIKALLGEEDYAVYQSYEATQPERMQVTMFKGGLDANDQLTTDQEDKLIQAMHAERTNFQFSVAGFGDRQMPDPSQFTPDRIAKLLEESAKLQDQYVARAAGILTPSQLEQFKANQKQQQAMQEMGMKMATKMFGQASGGASEESPQQ